jgi:hypothetical protein
LVAAPSVAIGSGAVSNSAISLAIAAYLQAVVIANAQSVVNRRIVAILPIGVIVGRAEVGYPLRWYNGTQWRTVHFKRYINGQWVVVTNVKAYSPAVSSWRKIV